TDRWFVLQRAMVGHVAAVGPRSDVESESNRVACEVRSLRNMISSSQRATIHAGGRASRHVSLLALLVGAATGVAAYAGNLSFLNNSPIAYFKPDDVDLMMENARKVLDSSDPAAKHSWSNPKTGASGFAQAKGQFAASDGAPCKRVRIMNKMKNMQSD